MLPRNKKIKLNNGIEIDSFSLGLFRSYITQLHEEQIEAYFKLVEWCINPNYHIDEHTSLILDQYHLIDNCGRINELVKGIILTFTKENKKDSGKILVTS